MIEASGSDKNPIPKTRAIWAARLVLLGCAFYGKPRMSSQI